MVVNLKPKAQVGTEAQVLQETVQKANTVERDSERELIKQHDSTISSENVSALRAKNIYAELGGDLKDRMSQPRSIHLVMTLDARPEVVFTGFWDGRLIQSAMNAIARQYRQRRIVVAKTLGGKGDVRPN